MANRAYASLWAGDFSEERMLETIAAFLGTIPFSESRPGFSGLVIRALDPAETPLIDRDFRAAPVTPASLSELIAEHLHADCAYETRAHWDLWTYAAESGRWQLHPEPLEIVIQGEIYDDGGYAETGNFCVDAGFEHLFTGHAGLLGTNRPGAAVPQHPAEAEFVQTMLGEASLRDYHARTRENIRKLMGWMHRTESALPGSRHRLWSEGEENFEARLDEILAVR